MALIACAMLAGIPNRALAGKSYYYDGDPLNFLPMGGDSPPSEQEILAKALAMPDVLRAMQEFDAIGYVRAPEYDKGGTGSGVTCAALAYEVPGRPEAGAVLVARTAVDGGTLQTRVFGGSYVLDPGGDMAPDTSPDAAGVVITILDMNSSQASNYTTRDPRESARKFRDWTVCTVTLCGASIATCRYVFMPKAVGACSAVGCLGAAALCAS